MKVEEIDLEPRTMMGVHEVVPMTGMVEYFTRALTTSAAALGRQSAYPAGPAIALYHGKPTDVVDVTAGFPVVQSVKSTPEAIVVTLPGGPAIQTTHTGSYDSMTGTYDQLMAWVTEQDLKMSEDMWEEYLTGPADDSNPATWTTRIVWPLA